MGPRRVILSALGPRSSCFGTLFHIEMAYTASYPSSFVVFSLITSPLTRSYSADTHLASQLTHHSDRPT